MNPEKPFKASNDNFSSNEASPLFDDSSPLDTASSEPAAALTDEEMSLLYPPVDKEA